MPSNNMEDQLRQRLSQQPTPVDFEALWDKVEPRLPKKKRRVLPFWFWLIVGLTLSSSLLLQLPDGLNTRPLDETTETTPPPLSTETLVLDEANDLSQLEQKSSVIATEGTATDVPLSKPPQALKTSRTSQPTKTVPAVLEPSVSVMERKVPMVYATTETPGPEVNTLYPTLTDKALSKSGAISLSLTSPVLNEQTTTKPYVVVDPTSKEEDKGPTMIKNVTETPKTDLPATEYKTEDDSHATKKMAPRQQLEAAKIAETEAKEAERERRAVEKITARQNREAEKIAEAEARQVEKERRQREKVAAKQAEELARQEREAKQEIARFAAAERKARKLAEKRNEKDAAIRKSDEKKATKVARASQKTIENLAKSKALKVEKEQREAEKKRRVIEKMEAKRAEVIAAQKQEQESGSQQLALVNARRQAKEGRYRAKQAERAQREEARQREKRARDSTPGKEQKESARLLAEARKQDAKQRKNLIKEGARKRRLLLLNERLPRSRPAGKHRRFAWRPKPPARPNAPWLRTTSKRSNPRIFATNAPPTGRSNPALPLAYRVAPVTVGTAPAAKRRSKDLACKRLWATIVPAG